MPIISVQVLLGQPRPRPPVGWGIQTFFSQPLLRSTWPCHLTWWCVVTLPDFQVDTLQEILGADVVLGGNTAPQQIIAQSLHCRQWKSDEFGAQVSLAWSMALLVHRLQNIPLMVKGNEWGLRTRANQICSMPPGILWWKWVHNCHLRINSPRGNKWMAPPQASPYQLWPLSLVCHLLTWLAHSHFYT